MTLRLTNTLTRSKQDFVPLDPPRVSIYCCGVTVYDLCHLGHARSYIVWDVLRRYLIWKGYAVLFVQNFTDIDDKILRRANEEGGTMESVSERNIEAYFQDMDALNILRADRMPRATRCLDAIRSLIAELQQRGAAYAADGDVFFSVMSRRDYGKLSGRTIEEQREGASGRTGSEEEARKRHPFDFALWKGARPEEPSFPSPWGPGRPGWHIECSAMVRQELGETIDIHLGGSDLIFPHHENEIAQSETATGRPLAQVWLHNGMVNVGGEKMSKSLGNFTTIRALLESGVSPMTLRLFVLQAHYRKPLDFTAAALEAAANGWRGLSAALAVGRGEPLGWSEAAAAEPLPEELRELRARFIAAMDDDLNTSVALGELFELARPLRALAARLRGGERPSEAEHRLQGRWRLLVELAAVLGLQAEVAERGAPADAAAADAGEEAIRALLLQRLQARQQREFARADQLREQLQALGLDLFDRGGARLSTTASGGPLREPITVELSPPED